jgi:hypothetical protein
LFPKFKENSREAAVSAKQTTIKSRVLSILQSFLFKDEKAQERKKKLHTMDICGLFDFGYD